MLLQNLLHITLALLCYLQHICICDPLDSMSYARCGILLLNQIPTIKPINQYATFTLHCTMYNKYTEYLYFIMFVHYTSLQDIQSGVQGVYKVSAVFKLHLLPTTYYNVDTRITLWINFYVH